MAEKNDATTILATEERELERDVNREQTAFDRAHPSAPEQEAFYHERRVELRAARRAGVKWRRLTRWMGLAIFLVGALLLVYVFTQALAALNRYSDPGRLNSAFNSMAGDTLPSVIQAVFAVFGTEILRVFYLLILGFVASALAARGIQFFAASESIIDEAVVPEE